GGRWARSGPAVLYLNQDQGWVLFVHTDMDDESLRAFLADLVGRVLA
ncbi:MAG: hypothetical protein ISN29_07715, partial [Gammaproteobacteria bacterium AqS3]|nr:hypothetical protein [Gammaproteobacteria bacterium AqS3]